MSVPDAIAAATGLDLALVQGYAESLASADMWPNDGEPVEPKHAAALLVAATETRRTMRFLDRTNRSDFADELEFKRENLLYGQLSNANKMLRAIRRETEVVFRAKGLDELQGLARQRSRIAPRRPKLETQLRRRGEWDDAGKLKRWLIDDLTRERNEFAKEVMQEIEAERESVPAR